MRPWLQVASPVPAALRAQRRAHQLSCLPTPASVALSWAPLALELQTPSSQVDVLSLSVSVSGNFVLAAFSLAHKVLSNTAFKGTHTLLSLKPLRMFRAPEPNKMFQHFAECNTHTTRKAGSAWDLCRMPSGGFRKGHHRPLLVS